MPSDFSVQPEMRRPVGHMDYITYADIRFPEQSSAFRTFAVWYMPVVEDQRAVENYVVQCPRCNCRIRLPRGSEVTFTQEYRPWTMYGGGRHVGRSFSERERRAIRGHDIQVTTVDEAARIDEATLRAEQFQRAIRQLQNLTRSTPDANRGEVQ